MPNKPSKDNPLGAPFRAPISLGERIFARSVFFLLLLCISLCAGCAQASAHKAAIQQALLEEGDAYLEVPGLASAVSSQLKEQREDHGYVSYVLTARMPDYAAFDLSQFDLALPKPTYESPSGEGYLEDVGRIIQRTVDGIAAEKEIGAYVDVSLHMDVTKAEEGAYTATLSSADKTTLRREVAKNLRSAALTLPVVARSYRCLCVAEEKDALLTSLTSSGTYAALTQVLNVEELQNGQFSLTCACPSPKHVFETIEKRYLSSFHSPVFGALQVDFSLADIPRADYEPVDYTLTVVQTSGDLYIISDDGGLVADLVDARREAIASAQREADAKWVVPAADVPKSGAILSGVSKGVTAKLVTAKDAAGYYVRFFRVADLADENQGDLQASIYITGGKTARINLPAGFYRVLEAYGDTWYGKDYMFGPDGSYQRWNEVFEIEKGYVYTLTFHTENGNMDSTGVTYLD